MATVLEELTSLRQELDAEKAVTNDLRRELDLEKEFIKSQLEENEKNVKEQLQHERSTVQSLREELEALRGDVVDLRHDDASEQIAFSAASYSDFGPVTIDTIIPMEITYTNVGDGWNSVTNVFEAPVAGTLVYC